MDNTRFFAEMLELAEPWQVKDVSLHKPVANPGFVLIKLEHPKRHKFPCAECGQSCPVADHGEPRQWRHLDSMHLMTVIEAAPPRTQCDKCGVKTVKLPWAEPRSRFTTFFEAMVILQLQVCGTYEGTAKMLRIDYDAVERVVERAVDRGLVRRGKVEIEHLGLDETQWKDGMAGSNFISALSDLKTGRIIDLVTGKDSAAAEKLLRSIPAESLAKIKVTCSDLSSGFTNILKEMIHWALHVHDKFHVVQLATRTVDAVRRSEMAQVKGKTGELTLKGLRFKLLKTFQKLDPANKDRLKAILAVAKNTAKAHEAKESLVAIMSDKSLDKASATSSLSALCEVLAKAAVKPVQTLGKTLKANLDSITNYFVTKVTNAGAESANSRIKKLIANANGIGSVEALRCRILFFCGGLSLLPDGLPFFFGAF